MNYHHPGPRRVWKGGSAAHSPPPFRRNRRNHRKCRKCRPNSRRIPKRTRVACKKYHFGSKNPENGNQKRPKATKKRKFTNGVLVRALDTKPGWIEIFCLQETAQTIRLNHFLAVLFFRTKTSTEVIQTKIRVFIFMIYLIYWI